MKISLVISQLDDKANILDAFKGLEEKTSSKFPQWFLAQRREAMSSFSSVSFPKLQDEEWKYTNIKPILDQAYTLDLEPQASPSQLTTKDLEVLLEKKIGEIRLVFIDGYYSNEFSKVPAQMDGLVIESFQHAIEKYSDHLKPYLGQQANSKSDAFTALNSSFIHDGQFILVPRGKAFEKPIELIYISTANKISQPRNLFVSAENSKASVIETHISLGTEIGFTNSVTEIFLGRGAHLRHYKIQKQNKESFHMASNHVSCEEKSHYESYSFTFGSRLSRDNLNVTLKAEEAECVLNGLYLVSGSQHTDHHSVIDHIKPHGKSTQVYKGVLSGRSRAVFNGKIFVRLGAQKTDAHQVNKNLLLSEGATIDTKPQLEILADDVKCTHGAAIGELDKSEIFYVRSRGLSEESARKLLTRGFANEVVETVKIDPLRASLEKWVWQALENG